MDEPADRDERVERSNGASLAEETRQAIRERASSEGIVTILFTDIVDSTRLQQRLGDEGAQERFRQHGRIVRGTIARHGGHEIKTAGDGFMIAFGDVTASLACAVELQRAVAEDNGRNPGQELQVRIGLNCGHALREEEDVFGSVVVVAARIASLARGGQILVTETARGLAGSQRGVRYLHVGRRRLKGLDGSYDLWAVPWREGRDWAAFWSSPLIRMGAGGVALVAVGGAVAGGLFATGVVGGGGDAPSPVEYRRVSIHQVTDLLARRASGDCVTEDIVYEGQGIGRTTGDLAGAISADYTATVYVREDCQQGLAQSLFTVSDDEGNALSGVAEAAFSITRLLEGAAGGAETETANIITGGTGIYDGASGYGTCRALSANQYNADGSVTAHTDADCEFNVRPGAAGAPGPVTLQGIGSSTEMTVFDSARDLPKALQVIVLYRNNSDEAQSGLFLRLPAPAGASIRAVTSEESQGVPAGERTWQLPDLEPGEVGRFQFNLTVLSAAASPISLALEIRGAGLERPTLGEPVTVEIVQ